jgi:hypothetical protein
MRILFSPAGRQHLTFQESPRKALSSAYLEAREKVWQQKLDDAHVRGLELWNGEIHTIERFIQTDESHLVIELSTCQYKDITFTIHHTIQGIVRDYGADHLHPYITINGIPVTEDGRCEFGLRGAHIFASDNMIGLIGGTANKDEMPINALDDMRRFMHMEMQEETRPSMIRGFSTFGGFIITRGNTNSSTRSASRLPQIDFRITTNRGNSLSLSD